MLIAFVHNNIFSRFVGSGKKEATKFSQNVNEIADSIFIV